MKQTELARALGVTQQVISYYETGRRTPSAVRLKMLAHYLGLSMDETMQLLPGKGET